MKPLVFKAIKVKQPIGEFFIASMKARDLSEVSFVDVRRMANEDEEIDLYLGIQRKISSSRISKIKKYVRSPDATFPSSVIVAVPQRCVVWNEELGEMMLSEYVDEEDPEKNIPYDQIVKILDGQHRLRGLNEAIEDRGLFSGDDELGDFELSVSIFVGADVAQQATIFSIVNLAQTKVNRSLVIDLAELSNHRSPQKSAHEVAVALDREKDSPFYKSIKRLGVRTPSRKENGFFEPLTQATFVDGLMPYLSPDPDEDRRKMMKNPFSKLPRPAEAQLRDVIFRELFLDKKEEDIAKIVWSYFAAVKDRWPNAWKEADKPGNIIRRTNGYRAFMRFLRPCYLELARPGDVVGKSKFMEVLKRSDLVDSSFNIDNFPPGSSGEKRLFEALSRSLQKS